MAGWDVRGPEYRVGGITLRIGGIPGVGVLVLPDRFVRTEVASGLERVATVGPLLSHVCMTAPVLSMR